MVRLLLLCMVNRMTLPVWLNRGAPATYTRPCLEDTTDVTVYPATGGNRLVCAPCLWQALLGPCLAVPQEGQRPLRLSGTSNNGRGASFSWSCIWSGEADPACCTRKL